MIESKLRDGRHTRGPGPWVSFEVVHRPLIVRDSFRTVHDMIDVIPQVSSVHNQIRVHGSRVVIHDTGALTKYKVEEGYLLPGNVLQRRLDIEAKGLSNAAVEGRPPSWGGVTRRPFLHSLIVPTRSFGLRNIIIGQQEEVAA